MIFKCTYTYKGHKMEECYVLSSAQLPGNFSPFEYNVAIRSILLFLVFSVFASFILRNINLLLESVISSKNAAAPLN